MTTDAAWARNRNARIAFGGSPIDRADEVRSDPDALKRLLGPQALVLQLGQLDIALTEDNQLIWAAPEPGEDATNMLFLGMLDGRAHFVRTFDGPLERDTYATPTLWHAMSVLDPGQLAIFGAARSLVLWHATHGFCAKCGGRTHVAKGGWSRTCEACGAEHFPRVDPVMITVVERDRNFVLLGRQPRFPTGRYSTLAGFVEPGETIEESVAREVHEEAGVHVTDVRYIASQPWPFPSSLMIGCKAVTTDEHLDIDYTELEDARWFTRDQVLAALNGDPDAVLGLPPEHAIGGYMIRQWAEGKI